MYKVTNIFLSKEELIKAYTNTVWMKCRWDAGKDPTASLLPSQKPSWSTAGLSRCSEGETRCLPSTSEGHKESQFLVMKNLMYSLKNKCTAPPLLKQQSQIIGFIYFGFNLDHFPAFQLPDSFSWVLTTQDGLHIYHVCKHTSEIVEYKNRKATLQETFWICSSSYFYKLSDYVKQAC